MAGEVSNLVGGLVVWVEISSYQPGGLSDSSRWSERSADHRGKSEINQHPEGVQESLLAPLQGAANYSQASGGLRYAPTTGYYLTALQAETHREGS